jgi:hypothetical protein
VLPTHVAGVKKADLSRNPHPVARFWPCGMDEQVIASMVERAFDFGCFLLSFCDHNTPTDQEFAKFADDVNEFATAASFIQQPLRNPSVILSPLLLRILGHISNDCTTILKRLRKLLARLDSRYRTTATAATKNPFLRVGSHHKTQCHQSLKDFLGQKLVILHRSQIILAKSTFNVILAVIKWVHSTYSLRLLV